MVIPFYTAMIVSRRTNKWKRSREFYPDFYVLYDATIGQCFTSNFDICKCPGCGYPYSNKNPKVEYKIKKHTGEKIYSFICADCQKDVAGWYKKNLIPETELQSKIYAFIAMVDDRPWWLFNSIHVIIR